MYKKNYGPTDWMTAKQAVECEVYDAGYPHTGQLEALKAEVKKLTEIVAIMADVMTKQKELLERLDYYSDN